MNSFSRTWATASPGRRAESVGQGRRHAGRRSVGARARDRQGDDRSAVGCGRQGHSNQCEGRATKSSPVRRCLRSRMVHGAQSGAPRVRQSAPTATRHRNRTAGTSPESGCAGRTEAPGREAPAERQPSEAESRGHERGARPPPQRPRRTPAPAASHVTSAPAAPSVRRLAREIGVDCQPGAGHRSGRTHHPGRREGVHQARHGQPRRRRPGARRRRVSRRRRSGAARLLEVGRGRAQADVGHPPQDRAST